MTHRVHRALVVVLLFIALLSTFPVAKLPPTHKDKVSLYRERKRERDNLVQALIKFKNYFYFEERDEQVDDVEKVHTYVRMVSP